MQNKSFILQRVGYVKKIYIFLNAICNRIYNIQRLYNFPRVKQVIQMSKKFLPDFGHFYGDFP